MIFLQVYIYLCLVCLSSGADESEPIVETVSGKVEGFTMTSRSGKKFFAFKGIPYAKPPIGQLRFQPPEPVEPWSGVLAAKSAAPFCIQVNPFSTPTFPVMGFEDCLYLSVFTKNLSGQAPVAVHFHGGAFASGTGEIAGPEYLIDEDVVYVAPNFRLGIFGFLSFEDDILPGNQGLKDQVQILRWIQQNIARFGGDPRLVTLIGESSGAASAYHHIISPLSRGLFHRAMAESGTSYTTWAVSAPGFAKASAEKLMYLLDCPKPSRSTLNCLLKKNASEIASKFKDFVEWEVDPVLTFGPVLEPAGPNAFLVGTPSHWEHSPVPLLMGITSGEGLLRTSLFQLLKTDFKWFSDHFNDLGPITLLYHATASIPQQKAVIPKIREFYFPNHEITINDWTNLTQMYSDSWFLVGAIDGANKHNGDVYFYYFDYIFSGKFFTSIDPKLTIGAFHCSDATLIWNLSIPILPALETEEDVSLSQQYIKIVVDFMKYGNPTPGNKPVKWQKWTQNENRFVEISRNGFHMKKTNLHPDRYKFWKSLKLTDNFH